MRRTWGLNSTIIVSLLILFWLLTGCRYVQVQKDYEKNKDIIINFSELHSIGERAFTVYEDDSVIYNKYGKAFIFEDIEDSIKCFVEYQNWGDKTQFIAIRGTANISNVITDVKIANKKYDSLTGIHYHRGFYKSAQLVYGALKTRLSKESKIRITGHSLGGSVAVILGTLLHADGYTVDKIVTFGQPRFTNSDGVKKYSGILNLTRIVDANDMVPTLPPLGVVGGGLKTGYKHFGIQINIYKGKYFTYLEEKDAQSIFATPFFTDFGKEKLSIHMTKLDNHKMERYLKRLKEKATGAQQVPFAERDKYIDR